MADLAMSDPTFNLSQSRTPRTLEKVKPDERTREMPPTIAHAHRLIAITQKPAGQRAGLTGCPCSLQRKQPVKETGGEQSRWSARCLISD